MSDNKRKFSEIEEFIDQVVLAPQKIQTRDDIYFPTKDVFYKHALFHMKNYRKNPKQHIKRNEQLKNVIGDIDGKSGDELKKLVEAHSSAARILSRDASEKESDFLVRGMNNEAQKANEERQYYFKLYKYLLKQREKF